MKLIEKIVNGLVYIERSLLVLFVVTMVVLSFLQVVLRNVFSFGFFWADPLLRYIVMWAGFLGAVLATNEEKHFGIDIFNRFLSRKAVYSIKTIIDAVGCVVTFLLARAAIQFLFEAIGDTEMDLFGLPRRLYLAIIPAGFGLITFHFVLNMIRNAQKIFTRMEADLEQAPISEPYQRL